MSRRSMRRARQRRTQREQRRRAVLLGAAGAALLGPAGAEAATFNVTSTADSGAGTLRQAVGNANASAGDDTITFSGAGASGTIRLTSGEIEITGADDLTITGPGRDQLAISGDANNSGTADAGDSRIFNVSATNAATVNISGLTLTRGFTGTADDDRGGALRVNSATLNLTDAAVTNSTTQSGDGGGGLYIGDDFTLTRTSLTGNLSTAFQGGGAQIAGSGVADHVTVTNNSAASGAGIAVAYEGGLKLLDSTVSGNQATDGGGGGLLSVFSLLRVERSTISGNTAETGAGVFGYTAKYGSGIFNSTVSGNTATNVGGGVVLEPLKYEAQISESTVSGNKAPDGAGIVLASGSPGTATLERSLVQGNTATGDASAGGGVLLTAVGGQVRLLDSTVTGNAAAKGGGVAVGAGGPVFQSSDGQTHGSVDLDNSTISGNTGGGVVLSSYDFGSPAARRAATIGMSSTIVSGNQGGDTDRADDATSGGINAAFSLIQAPGDALASSAAVITGKDPQLGALAGNGGPTQTMLPAGTSPALDQGRSGSKNTTDQRGQARLVDTALPNPGSGGDGTDMGAVELPAAAVVIPVTPGPSPAPVPAFSVTAGAAPITSGVPLLPASLTPLVCRVTIVKLTGCDVAIRATKAIKLTKKTRVPAGTLLAEAQPAAAEGAASLSQKATLTADGRAVLKRFPIGVDARAVGVGSYSAANALTASGRVHLLAGPSVTLKLKKGTKLSKAVKTQLGALGKLITGAKTVSVSLTGPSKKKAAKVAKAAGAALTSAGVKVKPTTAGKKAKKRRLKVTFTL